VPLADIASHPFARIPLRGKLAYVHRKAVLREIPKSLFQRQHSYRTVASWE
jgi:hypothetical protein